MGSSGSTVGSWVRASQSLPPYGIRAPPWQDVAAHAAPPGALHQGVLRQDGLLIFPGVVRQHSKKPCATQELLPVVMPSGARTGGKHSPSSCIGVSQKHLCATLTRERPKKSGRDTP